MFRFFWRARAAESSERRFDRIISETRAGLFAYVFRRTLGDEDLTEEVTQRVYETASLKREELISHPNAAGWLYSCARNIVREELRSRGAIAAREVELTEDVAYVPLEGEDAEEAMYNVLGEEIMAELSERDIWLIERHFIDGVTIRELAKQLDANYDALQKYINRLMKKIRQKLEEKQ